MYTFNETLKVKVLKGRTITYIANEVGITKQYLTSILNGKRECSKTIAYCITKSLCMNAEISDYFTRKEK